MRKTLLSFAAVLVLSVSASAAEKYRVKDSGGFGPTGRYIEFASRYGWKAYEVDFKFGVDWDRRVLSEKSKLTVKITKNDGKTWKYKCRAKDRREMWANINKLYGKGISVLTECRIDPKDFGKAVGLDYDLVGEPTLVFQVMIKNEEAEAGVHKGMYFLSAGQIAASPMNQYATKIDDPSNLGVLFSSKDAGARESAAFVISANYGRQ